MDNPQRTSRPSIDHVDEPDDALEIRPDRSHLNMRLDRFLAAEVPDLSRSYLQQLIDDGHVLVDGRQRRTSFKMTPGQVVTVVIPPTDVIDIEPQDIPLDIVFEDDDVLVVNKPAGMVVHPAPGHPRDTLVNAVLFHAPGISIQGSTRPGIVHRLDKDTSGVMVVAKTDRALNDLVQQWQARSVGKWYVALAAGAIEEQEATIDAPVGRHAVNRQEMTTTRQGRDAVTHFTVTERSDVATLLDVSIETGRTHQIRVHLAFIGHPVVGDQVYGSRTASRLAEQIGLERQFLHASRLAFDLPSTGEHRTFEAPVPSDLHHALERLRQPESFHE